MIEIFFLFIVIQKECLLKSSWSELAESVYSPNLMKLKLAAARNKPCNL